ncbi:MAG TPA: SAM-dependent methyltransferase [Trebonia sp.]|nr:SAM-dependent methyltransferase [Trebonia sp.]
MAKRDWVEWHRGYDDPGSLLSRRGELVRGHLRAELDRAPAGDVRLISLCAGQGRDVIGGLTGHPRRDDVRARLVELDGRNVGLARRAAQAAGLAGVEVLQADAGVTDACAGAVPAQVVVACGIFGNITGTDIQATVAALPSLCAPGALVLWTRHRGSPDLTPVIRSWFAEAGFHEEAFDTSHDGFMSVGAHRLTGEPAPLVPGQRLFTFAGGTELAPSQAPLSPETFRQDAGALKFQKCQPGLFVQLD